MQSRQRSMVEVVSNTFIGFVGSLIIVYLCIKMISNPESAALISTALCTVWSLVRGYAVRRYFNKERS